MGRGIEREYEHELKEAEFVHRIDDELAHEHGYHEVVEPSLHETEDREFYGSQRHMMHDVEDHEEPSWRDDKYHDHSGFDLRQHDYEQDHRGISHEVRSEEHHETSLHQNGGGGCNFWDIPHPVNGGGGICNQLGCPCASATDCCQDNTDQCMESYCSDGWCQARRFGTPVNGGGGCIPTPVNESKKGGDIFL